MLDKRPVYINIEQIGHISRIEVKAQYGRVEESYTSVGVTTHNNGGFKVIELPEAIIKLIEASRGV
jgi:hypothetical protein